MASIASCIFREREGCDRLNAQGNEENQCGEHGIASEREARKVDIVPLLGCTHHRSNGIFGLPGEKPPE